METINIINIILCGVAGLALSQWYTWRMRALYQHRQTTASKAQVDRAQQIANNLDDERRVQHEAMMEAFDYINDNGPFGTNDIGLMQVKGVLLRAIQTSTYGRGK